MKNIAFIFARGGSKGLPGKNIKPLLGKPLIAYSIELARNMPEFSHVFVSTDDADIASVASEYGAQVISRPVELARDDSPEWLAWQHAIKHVREQVGDFTHFVSLPATSPLRSEADVRNGIAALVESRADVCVSVTESGRSPYFNMVHRDADGAVALAIPTAGQFTRRQDVPRVFDLTTVVYVTTPSFVLSSTGIFAGTVTSVTVPKHRAVDIDDIYDFWFAESVLAKGGALE